MAQTDGHVPEPTLDPRKCFLRKVDQSQSAPSRRMQPASLLCSRLRVILGNMLRATTLFNILLGSRIVFTPLQIISWLESFLCARVWTLTKWLFFYGYCGWLRWHTIRYKFLQIRSKTASFHRGCGSCWSEPCWTLRLHTFELPWALFAKLCVSFYRLSSKCWGFIAL